MKKIVLAGLTVLSLTATAAFAQQGYYPCQGYGCGMMMGPGMMGGYGMGPGMMGGYGYGGPSNLTKEQAQNYASRYQVGIYIVTGLVLTSSGKLLLRQAPRKASLTSL